MTIQHSTMNNSDKAFANYTNTNLNDSHLVKYNNGYDNYYYTNVNKNLKKSFLPVSQSKLANFTTSNNLNIIKPNTKINNAQLNKNNYKQQQDNDTGEYYSVPYNYFNPTNKNINVNDLHKNKHPLPSLQQKNSISSNQQQPQQPQQAKLSRKNLNESPPHQGLLNNENAKAHQQQSQIKNSTPDPVKSKNSLPNSLIGKAIVRNMNDSKLSKKETNGLNSNKTKSETNLASTEQKVDKKASELAVSNSISSNNSNLISNNGKILVKKKKKAKMSSDEELKNEQRLKRSVSMINGLDTNNANMSNHKLKPSRHELSSRSSSSSLLLSTCSSIVNSIEDTNNLYELTIKIKKYLNKIEKNFSLESLYDYLKSNVKYNGYRNFTLDSLEPYLLASNRTSNMGLYETNGSQLQTKNNNGNNQPYRSLSQLRKSNNNTPYLTQQSQNSNYDLNGRPNNKRPVESLFKNMNVFKNLLVMIQRNLLDELVDLPPMQNEAAYKSPLTPIKSIALSPRSAERQEKHANLNKMNRPGSKSLINLNQIDSKYSNHKQPFVSQITKSISSLNYENGQKASHAKLKESLKKYNRKLYDLNEKLTVLINDQTSCDLKLLSFNSNLPIKYEYYKHGEYILRLTTDIIFKMRLVLKLSEKAYQLNYKLNARENSNASRLSFYQSDKIEEGEGSESDRVSSSDGSNRDSILRKIGRKKTNSRMQLPKINHRVNSKTANLNKDIRINNNLSDDIDIGPFAYGDNYQAAKQQQNKMKEAQTNKLKEDFESINNLAKSEDNKRKKLVKQDTNDSFIQDTDCSSILSEDSNAYFSNEINEITSKDKKDNSDYIKVNVAENPKPTKNEANANPKTYSKMQKVEDRNNLFEAYQSVRAQMESTNQNIRELNIYLQTLIQRAERCAKLEDLLHSDQDLIRKTENSLKVYGSDKLKNAMDPNSKMNDVFKAQLEKQLDYLQYRFKLNLQDLNLEQMCAPEIGAAISDTELKLKSLNSNMKELNKTLFYIEYELFERPKILDNKTSSNMSNYNNYNGNYYNNNNNHHHNGNNNGSLLNEDSKKKKPLPPLNGNGQHYPMNQSVSMQSNINNQNYYK